MRREENFKSKGKVPNFTKRDVDCIIGDSTRLYNMYQRGNLDTEMVVSLDGISNFKYLGTECSRRSDLFYLFDYVLMHCYRRSNWFKSGKAVLMCIAQKGSRVGLEVYLAGGEVIGLSFNQDSSGWLKYKGGKNIDINALDVADLENLVSKAISDALSISPVPVHSIECWLRNPISESNKVFCLDRCYVGFAKSLEEGEYVISFLVG